MRGLYPIVPHLRANNGTLFLACSVNMLCYGKLSDGGLVEISTKLHEALLHYKSHITFPDIKIRAKLDLAQLSLLAFD